MSNFKKFGYVQKAADMLVDMGKVNAQALKELTPEDIFVFRVAAADDQIDRDHERFSTNCLEKLARLFVGKPMIMDHRWSAANQTARIFDGALETQNGVTRMVLSAYMMRGDATEATIRAIEGGILREVSIGCGIARAVCSVCGADKAQVRCAHRPGHQYEGALCTVTLDEPMDAYECSFVAVPAQPEAGVIKAYGGESGPEAAPPETHDVATALALLELEEKRFLN